jgi:hypothetical protein
VGTPGIRSWFARDMLELLERGGASVSRLGERLPQRLLSYVDSAVLRAAGPTDTIPLDDAEELFLNIDVALGDGSGRVLENVSLELASRSIAQGTGVVLPGDLMGTLARMQAIVERPFVGVDVLYQLLSTDTGFSLAVGVTGRPRSARLLRHFTLGAVRAAQRFSRGADDESLKLQADTVGDRTSISAHYRAPPTTVSPVTPKRSRRPSRSFRAVQPNLTQEVERILRRSGTDPPPSPSKRGNTDPPPGVPRRAISSTSIPVARSDEPPPSLRRTDPRVEPGDSEPRRSSRPDGELDDADTRLTPVSPQTSTRKP